jgi:sugar phosphate isomerase/epimerase
MKIKFFRAIWGMTEPTLAQNLLKIKQGGYDGVEMMVPLDLLEQNELRAILQDLQLDLIASQWAAAGNTFPAYLQSFEEHLYTNARLNPLFSNSQTGKDYYTQEQVTILIERAEQIAAETGVPVLHETHRGKFTFHPVTTAHYLRLFPELRLAADFSHWCTVCESYLQDQSVVLDLALTRADHIHARVGHTQAAQVNDPRAPEWAEAFNHHISWWDEIIGNQRYKGTEVFTICPEFGPYPYMPELPYSRKPLADLWEINLYMKNFLQNRYAATEESVTII